MFATISVNFKTDDEIIQPLESQGIKRLYSKAKKFGKHLQLIIFMIFVFFSAYLNSDI